MQPGDSLPSLRLEAAESGVVVDNAFLSGRTAVLMVHGSKTAEFAKQVAKAVRAKQMDAGKVVLVSIIDLRPFSGLWKKVATAQLRQNHAKLAARATEAGLDPKEHVLLCPDWEGAACAGLGVAKPDEEPAVIVADGEGKVLAVGHGDGAAQVAAGFC